MKVKALTPQEFGTAVPRLGEILADAVNSGAGVSFMAPFSDAEGAAYWRSLADAVTQGKKIIFAAHDGEVIAGAVILEKAWQPNQQHRGEISKMLVHHDYRRRGVGSLLVKALLAQARGLGLKLITFDTVAESPAEHFYRRLGFTCAGRIPGYALSPFGALDDTALFYMKL